MKISVIVLCLPNHTRKLQNRTQVYRSLAISFRKGHSPDVTYFDSLG